jgi:HD-GYP domain-containing protein (c-di-GMP phosphodiesterase class II)
MNTVKLYYPVHTLDNQLLLPAGSVLSTKTVEDLISSGKPASYQTYPLLEYGMVRHDLLRRLSEPPYDQMFSGHETIAEVMSLLERVHLFIPVLQSLDYFKSNDFYTYCHVLAVFALSALIAKDVLPDYREWLEQVSIGPTHDIGKICVPMQILKKDTPLTRAERSIIDHHTSAGYVLLSYFHKDPKNIAAIVARDHHERRDGSGVPRGIQLTDSLVEIIIVCDVYDALISPRPYRSASYDNRTALEEITKMAEMNKIGWEAVKSLVAHNRTAKPGSGEVEVSREKRGIPPLLNCHGVIEDADSDS